jgi:L-threonine kinase
MVDRLLATGAIRRRWQEIRIDICSTIPVAKGMASSTADIAATAVATAHHLGHPLDEATLARLCVSLEPTDSTLFRQLTLFDHNTAATQIACGSQPQLDLLVLESPATLLTTDYHRLPRLEKLHAHSPLCSGLGESSAGLRRIIPGGWAKRRRSAPSPASICCQTGV